MSDVRRWLESLGLGQYADSFEENDVEPSLLSELTDELLQALGITSVGHRLKLLKAARVEGLLDQINATAIPEQELASSEPTGEAERRQLTVMFCDLVGSVELGEQLDVEDYRDFLTRFRGAAVGAVENHNGFVARHQGDGLLVYFGYPQAREDDAERAVRAGLEVVAACAALDDSYEVEARVRVGIATGPTVVGDVLSTGASIRAELAALGPTPNLAARLQGAAEPNTVVISETTHDLTRGLFEASALQARSLKGIPDPVTPYRVGEEIRGQSRFVARSQANLSPFVGRDEELESLVRRWARVGTGDGQVVLVVGEAGIGKSRLVPHFREQIAGERYLAITLQCSPNHESSALYPSIAGFERALGLAAIPHHAGQLAALDHHLEEIGETDDEMLGVLAHLLSIPSAGRFSSVESMDAASRRERTLSALVAYVRRCARSAPLLCVFEDAHWADPTSREMLGRLVEDIAGYEAMLLVTTRPGFASTWMDLAHSHVLSLSRLEPSASEELAHGVGLGHPNLPGAVVRTVLTRAEGNPLFIEELTRAVLQTPERLGADSAIPVTLQDSLMARLDASDAGKSVAQCASVIGRTFGHHLIVAVWEGLPRHLSDGLAALERSGLISARGDGELAQYTFKHVLVRDTAYASLLREHRAGLHKRVAEALEGAQEMAALTEPEVIATHFTRAGELGRALSYRHMAGESSIRANALAEAEAHFKQGIDLLDEMPSNEANHERRVELTLALGAAQMPLHGFGSAEVRQTYTEARRLVSGGAPPGDRFDAAWGLWLNRNIGGDLEEAQSLILDIDAIVAETSDPDQVIQAHHAGWTTSYMLGEIEIADARSSQGRALYAIDQYREHAFRYGGHDPGVCGCAHGALTRWILGYPDHARYVWNQGMEISAAIAHQGSIGVARTFGAVLFQYMRDAGKVLELCDYSAGTPLHIESMMQVFRGWAMARLGEVDAGLRECEAGVDRYIGTGATVRLSLLESVRTDVLDLAGRRAEALTRISSAVDNVIESAGKAELLRMKGAIQLSQANPDRPLAERMFLESLRLARKQKARSWELRTATSLARMWREQGKFEDARSLLEPIYGWFTEGFETVDLREAGGLMEELY